MPLSKLLKLPCCLKVLITIQFLSIHRQRDWTEAEHWYQEVLEMTKEDDEGTFDATMDDPPYKIQARLAEMYREGGFDLEAHPSKAGIMAGLRYNDRV